MRESATKYKTNKTHHLVQKVVMLLGLSVFATTTQSEEAKTTLYKNETNIVFKANSGATTDAVEGFLHVPENRNNPNSRQIRVNYVRFPAKNKNAGEPIVYLSGGPGGSGIGTAKWRRFPLFEALREYGDVIALDQRGTGASERAEYCESSELIEHNKPVARQQVKQAYTRAAKECLAKWQKQGIDVYGYTTEQNALDINDLRKHLQADKVSLWGISYGSHLALSAMKLFPDNIDKVIIASAEGLNQTVKLPAETDKYFERIQQVIDQQELKTQVPDLVGLMKRVHKKLDVNPMPIKVTYQDGSSSEVLLQSDHLRMMSSMMIADPNQYLAMLLGIYATVDQGQTFLVSKILERGILKPEPIGFELMSLAMDVASGITKERLDTVKQQAETSLLADFLNFPMPLLNNLDAQLDLGDKFRAYPKSNIPTLLLTGTLDGRTYPSEQRAAVRGLRNVTQINVENAGHNLYTASPEVLERMKAFLSNQTVKAEPIRLPLPELGM